MQPNWRTGWVKTDSKSGAASKSGDREESDISLEDGYFAGIWGVDTISLRFRARGFSREWKKGFHRE